MQFYDQALLIFSNLALFYMCIVKDFFMPLVLWCLRSPLSFVCGHFVCTSASLKPDSASPALCLGGGQLVSEIVNTHLMALQGRP